MKRSSSSRKTASSIPESIHQQLNMYALAAGAAGVGMLALAQFAEAEIIYTKAHVKLTPNHKFHLDLNHDGIKDFELDDIASGTSAFLEIHPLQMGNALAQAKTDCNSIYQAILVKDEYNVRVMNLSVGRPVYESYTLDDGIELVDKTRHRTDTGECQERRLQHREEGKADESNWSRLRWRRGSTKKPVKA